MALLPYTKRVAQTRTSRPPRDGDSRRGRDDAPRESQTASPAIEAVAFDPNDIEGIDDTVTFDDSVTIESADTETEAG